MAIPTSRRNYFQHCDGNANHHQSESQQSFTIKLTFILVMTKAATHEAKIRRFKPADGTM